MSKTIVIFDPETLEPISVEVNEELYDFAKNVQTHYEQMERAAYGSGFYFLTPILITEKKFPTFGVVKRSMSGKLIKVGKVVFYDIEKDVL